MTNLPLDTSLSLQQWLYGYGAALLAMLALDALWLTFFMGPAYKASISDIMLGTPKLVPAAAFYLLFALGLTVLAVAPAVRAQSWTSAALMGALLGLVAYATYDLTNLSILKNWPVGLALLDIAWGTAVAAAAAVAGNAAAGWAR